MRCVLLLLLLPLLALADEKEWFFPLGLPPKAKPRRISGGEGFPPLPLPVTPLRRSERKREPSPQKLIGKGIWGESASFTCESGSTSTISDWNLCPDDVRQLLEKVRKSGLGLHYGSEPVEISSFHGDPTALPVLFFSGTRTIRFSQTQLDMLRAYVLKGGMIVCDSIAGSPYFYTSIKLSMQQAFPEIEFRKIPQDHPLFHIVHDIRKASCPRKPELSSPDLEGMYVGCRIGVLLSKYGMGCGWDNHEVPYISKAVYYDVPSASKIGTNIVAYAVAYAEVAREEAKPEWFGTLEEKNPTDEFVFAQLRHSGAWNVHPGGAGVLLRELRQNTALRVSLKRVPVTAGKDDLSLFNFLYLTGLDDFVFDESAILSLQHFLRSAGTLFINNGMGMSHFDAALRREMKKILPHSKLEKIPPSHPLYHCVFKIESVSYTPSARQRQKTDVPCLEGIKIGGEWKVIYSPIDLESGWQGCEHVLCKGYESASALQMGINIVFYAMTH